MMIEKQRLGVHICQMLWGILQRMKKVFGSHPRKQFQNKAPKVNVTPVFAQGSTEKGQEAAEKRWIAVSWSTGALKAPQPPASMVCNEQLI